MYQTVRGAKMGKARTEASYSDLHDRIATKLKEAQERLKEMAYESRQISPREFYDFMTGETPTGDTINILNVLDNEYLMIHEVVEISELKRMGILIDKQTVMRIFPEVYEPHYTATEFELDYALDKNDHNWLKIRIEHAKSWLEDDNMPQHLVERYKAMIKRFSEVLESSS